MAEISVTQRPNSGLQESGLGPAEQGFEGSGPPIASFGAAQGHFFDAMATSGSHHPASMGVPPQPLPVCHQFLDIHRSRSASVQASDGDASLAVNSPENQGSFLPAGSRAALAMENQRLREQRICKLCRIQDVNAVLLPCGHLCLCQDCAQLCLARQREGGSGQREGGSGRCSTCGRNIQKIVRVYF